MKKIKLVLSLLIFLSLILPKQSIAQNCPVPPKRSFESNPDCYYSEENISYDSFDPCYQQYLDRKYNYQLACFQYWEEKKEPEQTEQESPQPQIIIKEVNINPPSSPTLIPMAKQENPSEQESEKEENSLVKGETAERKLKQQMVAKNELLQTENALSKFIFNLWQKIKNLFGKD